MMDRDSLQQNKCCTVSISQLSSVLGGVLDLKASRGGASLATDENVVRELDNLS